MRMRAYGQLNSGSIVVVESVGDYVVVAANSLNLSAKGISLHRCKIIALDNRLVYANTGYTSKASAHGTWGATDIAKWRFRSLRKTPRQELIPKLAAAYGSEVAARLEPDFLGHPEEGWPRTLTTAIFRRSRSTPIKWFPSGKILACPITVRSIALNSPSAM